MKPEISQPVFELVTPSRQDKFVLHWWLQERGYSCCNGNSLSDYDYSILRAFCLRQVKLERVNHLIKKLPSRPKLVIKKVVTDTCDEYDRQRDLYGHPGQRSYWRSYN